VLSWPIFSNVIPKSPDRSSRAAQRCQQFCSSVSCEGPAHLRRSPRAIDSGAALSPTEVSGSRASSSPVRDSILTARAPPEDRFRHESQPPRAGSLDSLLENLSNKEIASKLNIAERTSSSTFRTCSTSSASAAARSDSSYLPARLSKFSLCRNCRIGVNIGHAFVVVVRVLSATFWPPAFWRIIDEYSCYWSADTSAASAPKYCSRAACAHRHGQLVEGHRPLCLRRNLSPGGPRESSSADNVFSSTRLMR